MRTRVLIGVLFLLCVIFACAALLKNGVYGWTVFMVLPLCAGGLASWSFRPQTEWRAVGLGALTGFIGSCCFLLGGLEGFMCVLLSLPLTVPLSALGSLLAYQANDFDHSRPIAMALLIPVSFLFDINAKPPVYSVQTSIVVNAPPERVWKKVAAFPDIPGPTEWVFRMGFAYPQRTRIVGAGVGAARYCDLSTGPIVERVVVWNEPRMLRFVVTSTPPSMTETGLYGDIHPKHLSGYFISKQGQFTLSPLSCGRTLLKGTSWYRHGLWPAGYWRWWSDAIVRRVHLRVLEHIRVLSEDGELPR